MLPNGADLVARVLRRDADRPLHRCRSTGTWSGRRSPTSSPTAGPRRSSRTSGSPRSRRPRPTRPGCRPPARFAVGDVPGFRAAGRRWAPTSRRPGRTCARRARRWSTRRARPGRPKGVRRPLTGRRPGRRPPPAHVVLRHLRARAVRRARAPVRLAALPHGGAELRRPSRSSSGTPAVLMDRWDAEEMLRLIERHRVTHSHMVPTQFSRLLALPDDGARRATTSRRCAR